MLQNSFLQHLFLLFHKTTGRFSKMTGRFSKTDGSLFIERQVVFHHMTGWKFFPCKGVGTMENRIIKKL